MEAAALLAFAQARKRPLVAIAHITNALGRGQSDFDKGAGQGAETALAIASAIANAVLASHKVLIASELSTDCEALAET